MHIKICVILMITNIILEGQELQRGIVLHSITNSDEMQIEAGKEVLFTEQDSTYRVDVIFNNETIRNISRSNIIPMDDKFTSSRIYLELLKSDHEDVKAIKRKIILAKNYFDIISDAFFDHELRAQYCLLNKRYKENAIGGKSNYSDIILLYKDFLSRYPSSVYSDEFEWQILQMENYHYEYEGYAEGPLSEIAEYEKYLMENPMTSKAESIKLEIARLYRIAYECIANLRKENEFDGFTMSDADLCKEKAVEYYQELLSSSTLKVKSAARVALYNIKNNKRLYFNSNEW